MSESFQPLYGIDTRPPWNKTLIASVAHLLAIIGGIATAPLVIARGLNLSVVETNYIIASALTVSGIATFIQVRQFGFLGSGMLSVQGTSFAFVGVFIYQGLAMQSAGMANSAVLGTLLGTAAVGGLITVVASFCLQGLRNIITTNVAGIVVFLLGLSLVWVAFGNLRFAAADAISSGLNQWWIWAQAAVVIIAITVFAAQKNPWLKLASIMLGLGIGVCFAIATGTMGAPTPLPEQAVQVIQWMPFEWGFDVKLLILLLPIFLVTITESIGDLTATAVLSEREVVGPGYWRSVRGGVMADGVNTVLAACAGTFPNTTFSQNNGVIRLTGVASRTVGMVLAALLVIIGTIPLISALFQMLPGGVLHGATGLMFAMIMLTGWRMLRQQADQRQTMIMLITCVVIALGLTQLPTIGAQFGFVVPEYLALLTNFPVASGAIVAMLWESVALVANRASQPN